MRPGGDPPALASVCVAGAACALYTVLATPVARWGDAVDLARRAVTAPLAPYGRSYPLQSALVRAVHALGFEPARASSIVSALIAGVGVGLLHWVCRRYLRSGRVVSLGAAAAWGVNHVHWTSAVDGEVYGLLALYSVAAIAAVLAAREGSRGAWLCGVLVGLTSLHHRASLFLVPVLLAAPLLLASRGCRRAAVLRTVAGAVVGSLPFVALLIGEGARRGAGCDAEFWRAVALGSARNATLLTEQPRDLVPSLAYVARWTFFCFPGVALPIAGWGLLELFRRDRPVGGILLALGAAAVVLPLRMGGVGDRYVFLAAAFPVVGVALAAGLARIQERRGRVLGAACALACALAPPVAYVTCAARSSTLGWLPGLTPAAAADFFLPVRTGAPGSSVWAVDTLAVLGSGVVAPGTEAVYAEWGAAAALEYAQVVGGLAPELRVVRHMPLRVDLASSGERGLVVALTPIWADERGRLERLGARVERLGPSLYRVRSAR